MARPTEDELIARYFAPLARHAGADGLCDDVALMAVPQGQSLVVTTDALVAGVHFLADDPADSIARKALRVNLSDLAAKGARPLGFTLALALPEDWREDWLAAFATGLGEDIAMFGFDLMGGDTVKTTGPVTISVTALGLVPGDAIPRRRGARAGDAIYVSGTIGDAALGLQLRLGRSGPAGGVLGEEGRAFLVARYRIPEPRMALAPAVLAHASASLDISDGFIGDLTKLIKASNKSADVEIGAVPLSWPARAALEAEPQLIDTILAGGDDYEVLCTVAQGEEAAFEAMAAVEGIVVTRVGQVVEGQAAPKFRDGSGRDRPFPRRSFSHF